MSFIYEHIFGLTLPPVAGKITGDIKHGKFVAAFVEELIKDVAFN